MWLLIVTDKSPEVRYTILRKIIHIMDQFGKIGDGDGFEFDVHCRELNGSARDLLSRFA